MELEKIKLDANLYYRTPRGTTGRGKVTVIEGTWITVHDKTRGKALKLRAAFLSTKPFA